MAPAKNSGYQAKKLNLVLLGDLGVGKSSLATQFVYKKFNEKYQGTTRIDLFSKFMFLEDQNVCVKLWDTSGQESVRTIIPSCVKDTTVAVIVYDITDEISFQLTTRCIEDVRKCWGPQVNIMLVANKIDLCEHEQVSSKQGERKAQEHNVMFIETSARDGYNVDQMFRRALAAAVNCQK